MTGKVLQFSRRADGRNSAATETIFPGFSQTFRDFKVFRAGDLEIWNLNVDLADLESGLRYVEREGSRYYPQIASLFADLKSGRFPLGDARNGEIEVLGIGRIEISRFRQIVDYIVIMATTDGSFRVDYHQHVGAYRDVAASALLALTSEKLIPLVKQYRHTARAFTQEIPRGTRRPDESPEKCAVREGLEEAGIVPSSQTAYIDLGMYHSDTGIIAHRIQLFCATNVEVLPHRRMPDDTEAIHSVSLVSSAELLDKISSGAIDDGPTALAVLRAWTKGII